MRLINIKLEHRMFFEEFNEPGIPNYAILSHTWEKEEISYPEASTIFSSYSVSSIIQKAGYEKIKRFAAVARESKFDYIWIDTCCIDKSSSAELSEAINSMYRWYRNSNLCCIYLADVPEQPNNYHIPAVESKFSQVLRQTRWLTRGWTLQELLAPRVRRFYARNWQIISQTGPLHQISQETGIPLEAINNFKPDRWSIAQKMSWAAQRRTTRMEDRAYSLLGIFNVNMPLIYGESHTAFRRLQEEILRTSTDQTIFCWTGSEAGFSRWRGLLARSPSEFADSGGLLENRRLKTQPFQLTNKGIQMNLKLAPANTAPGDFVALLQCNFADSSDQCGIYIRRIHDDNYIRVLPNLLAKIPTSLLRNKAMFEVETLFAKPELAGITWQKSDMCPRIAGFRFLDTGIRDDMADRWNIWIDDIVPKDQFSWDGGIFSFGTDPGKKAPKSTIARCYLDSSSDCSVEIWVKYDWKKKYGEDNERGEGDNETCVTTDPDWIQSECCEWKIHGKSCDQFDISISSWIELDDKSDAYIHVEVFDSSEHDVCGLEEWECAADVTQQENWDAQAVGSMSVFPVQLSSQ